MLNIFKLYKKFLDFLYPFYCLRCNKFLENGYFCTSCIKELGLFDIKIICPKCERRKPIFEKIETICCHPYLKSLIYFANYEDEYIKKLIKFGKFEGYYKIWDFVGNLICVNLKLLSLKGFFISFIPMTKNELKNRGFNQVEIMANNISRNLNIKIFNGLIKVKETKQQSLLNFEERKENIKGAFSCIKKPPEKIILIDDIFTTGSTLFEASKTLKESGTKTIIGLVFAK